MKFLRRILLLALIASIASVVVAAFLMVESSPAIPFSNNLTATDLSQAELFIKNADPRELEPGEVSAFTVNERDLELVIGYALSQLEGGAASAELTNGLANLVISARLPDNPLGEYLNLQIAVSQWGTELTVESLKIGGVNIPVAAADWVIQFVHRQLQQVPEYLAALDAINGYSISWYLQA